MKLPKPEALAVGVALLVALLYANGRRRLRDAYGSYLDTNPTFADFQTTLRIGAGMKPYGYDKL